LVDLSPIVLFVYNSPEHTKRTVESLLKNTLASESRLIIFSDGAKNDSDSQKVQTGRDYIKTIKGFDSTEIVIRDKNLGLADSVITGLAEVFKQNDRVIVMEDDIITSPSFLSFMNKALAFYQDKKRIYSILGYPYPIKIPNQYQKDVFISFRTSSWGWGTWKDRWEKVDWGVKDFSTFISDKKTQKLFDKIRPRDINLEFAISDIENELTYSMFNEPALNGFSKKISEERNFETDYWITKTIKIKTKTLRTVLDEFLSTDKTIDFFKY